MQATRHAPALKRAQNLISCFSEQAQSLPTSPVLPSPSILLLFTIKGKPERGDRPAGTTPSEAALAKCGKLTWIFLAKLD